MTHKNPKDGLASKVLDFPVKVFKEDHNGSYFPFCSYGKHRGVILDENVCKRRDCDNYLKVYIRYGAKK
jgi:hypothetical protein